MTRVVPDAKSETLLPIIADRILPASTVYTDQYSAYNGVRWMETVIGSIIRNGFM
jgi:transposase-like protein